MEAQTDSDHEFMVPANTTETETNSNYVMCEGNVPATDNKPFPK